MKTYIRRSLPAAFALVLALVAGLPFNVAAASLNVGDPAPKLSNGKFVQGDPVKEFAPGKAYLVEFWATWCGPCKEAIPHLNETHKKFKDRGLVVIGQDCWEKETDDAKVVPFLKTMGEKMTYRVALDDKTDGGKGRMSDTWLTAAERKGIPAAFLVDTHGRIAWIGHPMDLREKTIESVLAGTFNGKEFAAAEVAAKPRMQALRAEIETAKKDKDWGKLEKALNEFAELTDGEPSQFNYVHLTRFNLSVGREDFPAAFKVAGELGEGNRDNAYYQNLVSLLLTTDPAIAHPDLDVALRCSRRAVEIADDSNFKGLCLDTLARVYFLKGDKAEAIAQEKKALELALNGDRKFKSLFEKAVEDYQRGELTEPTYKRLKPQTQ